MSDVVHIGDATLYHGDCMDILPHLGKVDAVVTDPPYGKKPLRPRSEKLGGGKTKHTNKDCIWDLIESERLKLAMSLADKNIIWGGQYYSLPPTNCWLVWDKKQQMNFAACEMAWTNLSVSNKLIELMWTNFADRSNDPVSHPTQKPLKVMRWCLTFIEGNTVLDPFMGSGTTGVACAHEYRFIGIEKERKYFDIACERIEAAYAQGRLCF